MRDFDVFPFAITALTVTDINRQVKALLEADPILEDVSVEGEVSNLSRPGSGHLYFTLKDDKSSLKCVMWRTSAPEFQELLRNGAAVIVHGRIGVYERDGAYQLYADAVYPVGQGKLYEAFLRLKDKLAKEGLFDAARKQPLPSLSEKIGIVTSASGAAYQDMLNTLRRRWPLAEVWLSPAVVQGSEAPASILSAFRKLEALQPDVILIGRGGGSLEDLWAFNDEKLVRAVADSPIPVVSGVGHETDFTLIDFAADFRAPTPTGAAVAASPDQRELLQSLDDLQARMTGVLESKLRLANDQLSGLSHRLEVSAPLAQIQLEREALKQSKLRLTLWAKHTLSQTRQTLVGMQQRLDAVSPTAVLARGYALIEDSQRKILPSAAALRQGQQVTIHLHDGSKDAEII